MTQRIKGLDRLFVILSHPRSGSNLLVSLLNSHPNALCFGEVFAREEILRQNGTTLCISDNDYYPYDYKGDPVSYVVDIMDRNPQYDRVGIKLQVNQLQKLNNFQRSIFDLLKVGQIPIIHLYRANTLDCLLSNKLGKATQLWECINEKELCRYNNNAVHIDKTELKHHYYFLNNIREWVFDNFKDLLTVEYEELIDSQTNILKKLGLSEFQLTSKLIKQRRKQYKELINNYETLYEQCRDDILHQYFCGKLYL